MDETSIVTNNQVNMSQLCDDAVNRQVNDDVMAAQPSDAVPSSPSATANEVQCQNARADTDSTMMQAHSSDSSWEKTDSSHLPCKSEAAVADNPGCSGMERCTTSGRSESEAVPLKGEFCNEDTSRTLAHSLYPTSTVTRPTSVLKCGVHHPQACGEPEEEHVRNEARKSTSSLQHIPSEPTDSNLGQHDALFQDEDGDIFFDSIDVFSLERNSDRESVFHSHHNSSKHTISATAEQTPASEWREEIFFHAQESLFPDVDIVNPTNKGTNETGSGADPLDCQSTSLSTSQSANWRDMPCCSGEAVGAEAGQKQGSGDAASAFAEKESKPGEEHMYCHCDTDDRTSSSRADSVRLAVQNYLSQACDLQALVDLLKSQPCSEDVIVALDELASVSEVGRGLVDLGAIVQAFGKIRGFHSRRTPLMCACRHCNKQLMESVLMSADTDIINATDAEGRTAAQHIFLDTWRDRDRQSRLVAMLRQYQGNLQVNAASPQVTPGQELPGIVVLPGSTDDQQDPDRVVRRNQSRLCQLAFAHDPNLLEELSPLFSQDITIWRCLMPCSHLLFPGEASHKEYDWKPLLVFHHGWADNRDVFLSIERGECPCSLTNKRPVSFLPACAAAAAGNVDLFRRMLESFVSRVQMYSARCCPGDRGTTSILKAGGAAAGNTQRKERKQVRMDLSLAVNHSDRLLAQALCHVIYANQSHEALRVLNDPLIQGTIRLTEASQMSLLDLSMALGNDSLFWELLKTFGPDIRNDSDGMTPLLMLVSYGRREMARTLLRQGVQRGVLTTNGRSALQIALMLEDRQESDKMALMLLDEGEGDTDLNNLPHLSALELAILHDRHVLLDYLIERGDVTVPEVSSYWKNMGRVQQVLRQPAVSWCTVRQPCYSSARYLIAKGLDCLTPVVTSLNSFLVDAQTPLQAVVMHTSEGALSLLDLLIEKGADVNEKTHKGCTPLVLAVRSSNKVLAKLIHAGAILDSPDPKTFERKEEAASVVIESRSTSAEAGAGLTAALSEAPPHVQMKNSSFLWHALEARNYAAAEMAVVAGYRADREAWFATGNVPPHLPQDVMDSLVSITRQPMPLISLCRRTVRERVGSGLSEYLRQSGLPESVADFIAMKDLVDKYLK